MGRRLALAAAAYWPAGGGGTITPWCPPALPELPSGRRGHFRQESMVFKLCCKGVGWCWLARGREEKAAEERGKRKEEEGEEEGKEEAEREAEGRRQRGPTLLAGTEASPISISQAASLCLRPHLPSGQWVGRASGWPWAPLLVQSGPACSPAGVGTVTVAKCANLCHCPQARGSHGDWLIRHRKMFADGNSMGFVHLFLHHDDSI